MFVTLGNRLDKLARDKHTSLFRQFVNYRQKCFITLGQARTKTRYIEQVYKFGQAFHSKNSLFRKYQIDLRSNTTKLLIPIDTNAGKQLS